MTEKEFLESAFSVIWPDATNDKELLDKRISQFLSYHHYTYYEVEFVKKFDRCFRDEKGNRHHTEMCKSDCELGF